MLNIKIEDYVKKQILIASCLYFGNIIAGYTTGWSSPVVPKLQDYDQTPLPDVISVSQASWVGSLLNLGTVIGPNLAGPLSNIIGRKTCILIAGCISMVAQIILAFSVNLPMIFVGRFIGGIGTGIIVVANVVYIGEMASSNLRGIILTMTGIFHVLGCLLAYTVGPFVSYAAVSYVLIGIGAAHLTFVLLFTPESPTYYLLKGDEKTAAAVLSRLGRDDDFKILSENAKKDDQKDKQSLWKELFTIKSNQKSLIITAAALTFQLGSGILAVLFFTTTIFESAGSSIEPNLATIIVGLTQFAGALVVPFVIEKAGRKTLMSLSTGGCCLSTAVMGIYFYLDKINHPSVPSIGWLPLATLVFMLLSFSIGLNIVPNTLVGEMFRPNVRSLGSSVAMTWGNSMGFISVTTFGYFVEAVGSDFTFWIFSALNGIGFLFSILVVPETKGKTLIEIEEMLSK